MKSNVLVGLLQVISWPLVAEIKVFGSGKVNYFINYLINYLIKILNKTVLEDGDFECLSVLQEHSQDVKKVIWHPDEACLASASYDDTIKIWKEDDDDWYCSDTLLGHRSTVWSIDFNAKGDQLVSVSDDQSVRLWCQSQIETVGIRKDPKWICTSVLEKCHSRSIYAVSWSKHHNVIATVGGDDVINMIQVTPEQQLKVIAEYKLEKGGHEPNCIAWCPLASHAYLLAVGSEEGSIRLFSFHEQKT
jgi:WD40 repeat protein